MADKTYLAEITTENLQISVDTSDALVHANSWQQAKAHCQLHIDSGIALLHPNTVNAAIEASDITVSFPLQDSVTFPDNTLYLLPIEQGPEVIGQGLAVLSPNLVISAETLLTLMGMDPATETFNFDPAEYTFTFNVELDTGATASIGTTLVTGALTGNLHATLASTFNWTTGAVDLNFIDQINPAVDVEIIRTHTDPATFAVTSETYLFQMSNYMGQTVFTCTPVSELPLYPTSIRVNAISNQGTIYALADVDGDGILQQILPELPADSLDNRATGTVNYETGVITLEFPEVVEHKTDITSMYAKLQNVVRFTPVSTEPPIITITMPVEDWDRVAHSIESALDAAEAAFKYRR